MQSAFPSSLTFESVRMKTYQLGNLKMPKFHWGCLIFEKVIEDGWRTFVDLCLSKFLSICPLAPKSFSLHQLLHPLRISLSPRTFSFPSWYVLIPTYSFVFLNVTWENRILPFVPVKSWMPFTENFLAQFHSNLKLRVPTSCSQIAEFLPENLKDRSKKLAEFPSTFQL